MAYPTIPVTGTQLPSADLQDFCFNPTYTYGETITAGDALYLKASDSKVYKADADVLASVIGFIGFAINSGVLNDTNPVYAIGKVVVGLSGLTAGSTYYLSNTAGGIALTEGTFSLPVGVAIATTKLLVTCSPQDIARIMSMQNMGSGTCGEAITAGQAIYMKASDGKLYKCDADADESTFSFVGVAQSATAGTGETVYFTKPGGIAKGLTSRTIGATQFISGTAGQIDETPGARYAAIGLGLSSTTILVTKPKFIIYGTQSITSATTFVQTCGFYPARVTIRSASTNAAIGGSSVGDDSNTCVAVASLSSSNFSQRRATDAWYVFNANTSTLINKGTVSAKSQTGFTLNCSTYGNTVDVDWCAEN